MVDFVSSDAVRIVGRRRLLQMVDGIRTALCRLPRPLRSFNRSIDRPDATGPRVQTRKSRRLTRARPTVTAPPRSRCTPLFTRCTRLFSIIGLVSKGGPSFSDVHGRSNGRMLPQVSTKRPNKWCTPTDDRNEKTTATDGRFDSLDPLTEHVF